MVLQQQNVHKIVNQCVIAFGSNLSNEIAASVELVKAAIGALSSVGLFEVELSKFYRTPAFPKDSGPDFVNGAILCETELSAQEVLEGLHKIEHQFGRTRTKRWEARILDLDLIDYAGQVLPDVDVYKEWREMPLVDQMERIPKELILPHPRVQDRPFVLVPLRDVAPEYQHPVTGESVKQMLGRYDVLALGEIQPLV